MKMRKEMEKLNTRKMNFYGSSGGLIYTKSTYINERTKVVKNKKDLLRGKSFLCSKELFISL